MFEVPEVVAIILSVSIISVHRLCKYLTTSFPVSLSPGL